MQELLALAKFVAHTIRQQRVAASVAALDVYSLAKRMSKRKDGAELKPFVDDMRNKLRKRAARKTTSDPVPAQAPVLPAPPVEV